MTVSAVTSPQHSLSAAWRSALLPLAALILGVLLVYRGTFQEMFLIWLRSDTFAHCLFVWPISLWLIWRQRSRLVPLSPVPALWVLVPMVVVSVIWLLGQLVNVNALMQTAMTALLVLSAFLLLGWRVGVVLSFPLGFMFFAVPVGEFLLPYFMAWTADFTVLALRLTGVPVYREGLQFVIPSGQWSVVEACSGIRYLMASMVVGTLFAYLNYRSAWRRWVFVGISILLPVVANWLRAYMIVMLGHLSDNEIATGADHLVYGWVFFGVIMLLMFMIGARWREDEPSVTGAAAKPMAMNGSPSAMRTWSVAILGLLVVSWAPWWFSAFAGHSGQASVELTVPAQLNGAWRRLGSEPFVFRPDFQNPSADFSAWYAAGPSAVGVHISYYCQQDASRKLVSSLNVLVKSDDRNWLRLSSASRRLELADGQALTISTSELRPRTTAGAGQESNVVVWRFYWVDGRLTSSDVVAKLYGAWGRFMGRPDDAAAIFMYAPRSAGAEVESVLERFTRDNLVPLQAALVESRDKRTSTDK